MASKKKRKTTPRRKRFKRAQRLESAKAWLTTYDGHNLARAYRRRYEVDWQTAFTELEMLDAAIDPNYKNKVLQSVAGELCPPKGENRRNAKRLLGSNWALSRMTILVISWVHQRRGGLWPYGLTWDEWEAIEREEEINGQIDEEQADEEGSGL